MNSIVKMSLMMFALVMFLQCSKKENAENNSVYKIDMQGELDSDASKTAVDNMGNIVWQLDDRMYMMSDGVDTTVAIFEMRYHSDIGLERASFGCAYKALSLPDVMYRDLYYLGTWRYYDDERIEFSIYDQSGLKDDFGKYFVAGAKNVAFNKIDKLSYAFSHTELVPMTSVARFDLSQLGEGPVYIEYADCNNKIKLYYSGITDSDYTGSSGYTYNKASIMEQYDRGNIMIRNTLYDTYVILFPQKAPLSNTVINFKKNDEVIATATFPNGVSANKLYQASGGYPIKVLPVNVKSDEEIVECELFN